MTEITGNYHQQWYRRNTENRKSAIRERQKQIVAEVSQYKLKVGCSICGYKKSAKALSFHHYTDNKEHNVARMCAQGRKMARIMEEIAKCICVCANCHAEIHDPALVNDGYNVGLSSRNKEIDTPTRDQ